MRSAGATQSRDPAVVTLSTNATIARFDGPSFQDGKASALAAAPRVGQLYAGASGRRAWAKFVGVLYSADLARGIFWLVRPSLALFIALPAAIKAGWGFWPSLAAGCAAAVAAYAAMFWLLRGLGVRL
jgi:hypothetical protein